MEDEIFFRLVKERKIRKSLNSKKFRVDDIFKHLESFIVEKGYNKTWK